MFTGVPRRAVRVPDGQWIGFMDGRSVLKKVAVTGGPAVTLATLDATFPSGATWGPDDTIIAATENVATGLQRVSAAGGQWTCSRAPTARKAKPITSGRSCCRADAPCCSRSRR